MRLTVALLASFFGACGAASLPSNPVTEAIGATPTVVAPVIKTTLPGDGDSDIAVTSLITVVFGSAMDANTIDANSIYLSDGTTGVVSWRGGRTATLLPKGGLAFGTKYTVVIAARVATQEGVSLGKDASFHFTTAQAPTQSEKPQLTITQSSPLAGAENVGVATAISATFSEEIDSASVTSASFFVGGVQGKLATKGKTITFIPSSVLAFSTTYKVTITTAIKNLAGTTLASKHDWLFTTRAEPDTAAPTLASSDPLDNAVNVALGAVVTLTFTESLKASTVSAQSVRLQTGSGSVPCSVTVQGAAISLTPNALLVFGATYEVIVTDAVSDAAGNHVSPITRTFATLPPPDLTSPLITGTTPLDGATTVDAAVHVSLTFSEPIVPASALIEWKDSADNAVIFVASYHGTTLTLAPASPLAAATTYSVTVSGVMDVANNPLGSPYTFVFTTN